jgi:hypothetical protein
VASLSVCSRCKKDTIEPRRALHGDSPARRTREGAGTPPHTATTHLQLDDSLLVHLRRVGVERCEHFVACRHVQHGFASQRAQLDAAGSNATAATATNARLQARRQQAEKFQSLLGKCHCAVF